MPERPNLSSSPRAWRARVAALLLSLAVGMSATLPTLRADEVLELSLEPMGIEAPVRAVLEIKGGESARRGIRTGDRVRHPAFGAR